MEAEAPKKATISQRAMHELREFVILTAYLYVTFGAVILMKAAVLHSHGISFSPWGIAIVKAALLAKFMLIGNAMGFGGRYASGPLIWPMLHKTLGLLMVLLVLTIVEEVIVGLFHHQSVGASLGELTGIRLREFLASIFIVSLVLIPYCAIQVLGQALGEGKLARMFFVERRPGRSALLS